HTAGAARAHDDEIECRGRMDQWCRSHGRNRKRSGCTFHQMVTDLIWCTVDGGDQGAAVVVMGSWRWLMRDYDGKTAAERIAERRERLIDAGVELFGERGYAATSIRSVLQQSGLRDRYFGESFADLDSLLAADLLPPSTALNRSDVLLLGLSIVAAADELLMTWMDSAEGLTRDRVVDVVMLLFDATAHHISST